MRATHTTASGTPVSDPGHELPPARRFDPTRELPLPQPHDDRLALEHQVERQVRRVEAHVRARPFVSVALAVAAGFFVGRIFRD